MQTRETDINATPVPNSVPGRAHYSARYIGGGRVFSFAHQIDTVISFQPRSVLEVGVGAGIVTAALRAAGLGVTTLDIQPELNPDLRGSVTQIPADDAAFDVALCSQVLEHLPFDQFRTALRELRRVTTKGLVLSLPDPNPNYIVSLRLPKIRRIHWTLTRHRVPRPDYRQKRLELDGHHWEIGYAGCRFRDIATALEDSGWRLESTWRVPEFLYHRFFKCVARQ